MVGVDLLENFERRFVRVDFLRGLGTHLADQVLDFLLVSGLAAGNQLFVRNQLCRDG